MNTTLPSQDVHRMCHFDQAKPHTLKNEIWQFDNRNMKIDRFQGTH